MPLLTDLANRLKTNPTWRERYKANLATSRAVAAKISLVHVSGNPSRVSFADLLAKVPYEIPTSDAAYGYCSDMTRAAEDMLNLGRCVYLYAGRAHPRFGKIALAFEGSCEAGHTGSATPFDTGGLANRKIISNLPDYKADTLKEFVARSVLDLTNWRRAFSRYLAAYFLTPRDYWQGTAAMSDPEELLIRNTDWRARVFEIRFHEGQRILVASFWCASKGQKQLLEREAKAHAPVGAISSPLQQLLYNVPSLAPHGTPYYCEDIETEVRRRVGL